LRVNISTRERVELARVVWDQRVETLEREWEWEEADEGGRGGEGGGEERRGREWEWEEAEEGERQGRGRVRHRRMIDSNIFSLSLAESGTCLRHHRRRSYSLWVEEGTREGGDGTDRP
jgi:hypothetical protein